MSAESAPDLVSLAAVARALGVCDVTARGMVKAGKLRPHTIEGLRRPRYSLSEARGLVRAGAAAGEGAG